VRGTDTPEAIPELMAYMMSIIRVSREYSGLGWMHYDVLFRKQAALKGDTKWSVINPTIYARCFTGAPREAVNCELCLSTLHDAGECPQLVTKEVSMETRLWNVEEAVQSFTQLHNAQPVRPLGEVCRKQNNQGCSYPYCRHTHVCSACGGPHPEPQCRRSIRRAGSSVRCQGRPY